MQINQLAAELSSVKGFEYRGDQAIRFTGLAIRLFNVSQGGRFAVLLDDSWSRATYAKDRLSELTLQEKVAKVIELGYEGFICSSKLAADPALEGHNLLVADSSRDLCFAILKVIQGRRGSSLLSAVTGSMGKSTTMAMLAHALRKVEKRQEVLAPPGVQNTYIFTMSHLSRVPKYRHTVIEVAAGTFAALDRRSSTVSPDVAIVTGISEAHLEDMVDLEGVAERKASIFKNPPPGGTAIINRDTAQADLLISRAIEAGCQLVTYGESTDATIRLQSYDSGSGQVVALVGQTPVTYRVGARGKHNAINSLAVLAALRSYRHPKWLEAIRTLESFTALSGRGQRVQLQLRQGGQAQLIDDAYNANPASMRSSLIMLSETEPVGPGRRVAVLGDMLELGQSGPDFHRDLVGPVLSSQAEKIHLFGESMRFLYEQLPDHTGVQLWQSLEDLSELLIAEVSPGDVVLVKGSQGTGLHSLVDLLKNAYQPAT